MITLLALPRIKTRGMLIGTLTPVVLVGEH